jgi:hypothetical protein
MVLSETARMAVEAYGGPDRWRECRTVHATISACGVAFRLKWQRPFERAECLFETRRPSASIRPIDRDGNTGILENHDARIVDPAGKILETRPDARRFFPGGRRALWWDRLDQTYFAGYALWNYMVLPALLLREDIEWKEARPGVLDARFPTHIPTHSRDQRFTFDVKTGLLRQVDYTAEVLGNWARAAMVVHEHQESHGIVWWAHRTGTPRASDGTARKGPVVVDIVVHDFRLV